jgi:hypothetical protein
MTDSLTKALKQFHSLSGDFNLPATNEQLEQLATSLKFPLNESLIALYHDHNGVKAGWPEADKRLMWILRLMSCEEAIAAEEMLQKFYNLHPEYAPPPEVKFFWTDDESNYAGVYMSGVLAGKVCLYDHEGTDFAPRFRSVTTFYDGLLKLIDSIEDPEEHLPAWYEIPSDYPLLKDAPETDADDLQLALEFAKQFEVIADRSYETRRIRHTLGFTAMNLLPFSASDKLLPFTKNSDMWIQAYACELLGKRRYLPAIPRLTVVALTGTHNGRMAAVYALKQMQSPPAKFALFMIKITEAVTSRLRRLRGKTG